MTIIKDIHAYLRSQGIDNLYRSKAPAKIEDVLWLVEAPSPPPSPSLGYYEQNLDVWARFRVTDEARDGLQDISDILHRKVAWETDNFYIYLSVANGIMTDMGEDIEGRKLFLLSFRIIFRE